MTTSPAHKRSWGLLSLIGLSVLSQSFFGCGVTDDGDPPTDPVVTAALKHVGPGVVLPALHRFQAHADTLQTALEAWQAAARSAGDVAGTRTDAQRAWQAAMSVWQELDVMQVGPAASSLTAVAGADLRDTVYSWPTVNRCLVDQETVLGEWSDAAYFPGRRVDALGLGALEVLLFSPPAENGCTRHTEPNASGAWDALGESGITQARADHAVALAAQLRRVAAELENTWSPDGVDFSALLASGGAADSPFESETQALNAVFDALFYVELITKDRKLAQPLGLRDCPTGECADQVEHRLSGLSGLAIEANLTGFRALFTGADGPGLDDVLVDLGHEALVTELLGKLDAAITLAASQGTALDARITDDPESVLAMFDAVKAVTDLLKVDVAAAMFLQIPAEAAGDND